MFENRINLICSIVSDYLAKTERVIPVENFKTEWLHMVTLLLSAHKAYSNTTVYEQFEFTFFKVLSYW